MNKADPHRPQGAGGPAAPAPPISVPPAPQPPLPASAAAGQPLLPLPPVAIQSAPIRVAAAVIRPAISAAPTVRVQPSPSGKSVPAVEKRSDDASQDVTEKAA